MRLLSVTLLALQVGYHVSTSPIPKECAEVGTNGQRHDSNPPSYYQAEINNYKSFFLPQECKRFDNSSSSPSRILSNDLRLSQYHPLSSRDRPLPQASPLPTGKTWPHLAQEIVQTHYLPENLPGICPIYLDKIAKIPHPSSSKEKASSEYNFYYNIITEHSCGGVPKLVKPCCANNPHDRDPLQCSSVRKLIWAVDPELEIYRDLYTQMFQRKCRDLPPKLLEDEARCEKFFKLIKEPGPKLLYDYYYRKLVMWSCYPLPAAPG